MNDRTTIFTARKVITMNPANPEGSAVAVRDGRVLGVGTVDELAGWGAHTVDDRFSDKVLMPGLIEAHCHARTGAAWLNTYVGFFDRRNPDGVVIAGCRNIVDVVERLKKADADMVANGAGDDEPLIGWSLDPLYFEGERMYASHLDEVSATRPIFVHHASGILATVNTALMRQNNIDSDTATPGVPRRADGEPNGELHEPPAMSLATEPWDRLSEARSSAVAIQNYAREARNTGTTLVTDLASGPFDAETLDRWRSATDDPAYPARVMLAASPLSGPAVDVDLVADRAAEMMTMSTDKLKFGIVKVILDGSIQGFTARLSWPYYFNPPADNPENGLWLTPPDQMADILLKFHERGLVVHCHCNGDQASEAYIDAVEQVLERHPRWDHRHTVQHCQLTTAAQYRRMKALGMCANIFSNHMFYWGDQHRDATVGPDRVRGMDACATARREGVSFSIHSDSPVTPLGGLHVAWCAVNRLTPTGDTLGEHEKISVYDALHAVTLGAAYQIKLDHEMGSIEAGKVADFAVLDDDPLEVDPGTLKDIGVWGTVLGGIPLEAEDR